MSSRNKKQQPHWRQNMSIRNQVSWPPELPLSPQRRRTWDLKHAQTPRFLIFTSNDSPFKEVLDLPDTADLNCSSPCLKHLHFTHHTFPYFQITITLLLLMLPDERKLMPSTVSIPVEQVFSELDYAESRETNIHSLQETPATFRISTYKIWLPSNDRCFFCTLYPSEQWLQTVM